MIEPWFDAENARYIALVAFSALVALLSPFITKGIHRNLVYSVWFVFAGIGVILLSLALVAHLTGQPGYVAETLFKGGISLTVAFSGSFIGVFQGYRDAELRKIAAHDL